MPLHMLVNTHAAESCAFRSDENREVIVGGILGIADVAKKHGATVQGSWINRAAHKFFVLIEAENAHVIDQIVVDCGWISHTESEVYAVTEAETAVASVDR